MTVPGSLVHSLLDSVVSRESRSLRLLISTSGFLFYLAVAFDSD